MVTVVIPTWNAGRYLQATLDSVFAQSYPAFEIVAVDDCSSDHTVSLLKSYGDRVRVVERTVNSGTADIPRYQGVEAARTELVALLDGDDVWEREKLAKQVAFMGANPQIPLSHHYVRIMDADGRAGPVRHDGIIPPTGPCAKELLSRCFICTSSVMVRREAWLGAQSPDQITGYGTELDFFIALARRSNLGFIPEVLGSYRVFPGSISRKSWRRYPRDVGAMERIFRKGLWRGGGRPPRDEGDHSRSLHGKRRCPPRPGICRAITVLLRVGGAVPSFAYRRMVPGRQGGGAFPVTGESGSLNRPRSRARLPIRPTAHRVAS
jgi:glycosyltransferase involved in cell wall biosynthesis